jgi:hypothetical protein
MAENDKNSQDEATIGKLIAAAGPGRTASPEARQRIYAAVRSHWEKGTRVRRKHWPRRAIGLAAAVAAVALGLSLLQTFTPDNSSDVRLAEVARVEGSAELTHDGETRSLDLTATIPVIGAGDTLRTAADGRLALRTEAGLLLRLNAATEIRFIDVAAVELVAGTVYVDTGGSVSAPPLEIRTPLGDIRHLGTQYEAHLQVANVLQDATLRVRIREGRVAHRGGSDEVVGVAGEQFEIDSDGLASRGRIRPDDPAWDWATALAALPPAGDYPLDDTLAWIARERGLSLEFESAAASSRVRTARPEVGLEGLNPVEALDVIERTTGVRAEIRDTQLVVLD